MEQKHVYHDVSKSYKRSMIRKTHIASFATNRGPRSLPRRNVHRSHPIAHNAARTRVKHPPAPVPYSRVCGIPDPAITLADLRSVLIETESKMIEKVTATRQRTSAKLPNKTSDQFPAQRRASHRRLSSTASGPTENACQQIKPHRYSIMTPTEIRARRRAVAPFARFTVTCKNSRPGQRPRPPMNAPKWGRVGHQIFDSPATTILGQTQSERIRHKNRVRKGKTRRHLCHPRRNSLSLKE